MTRRGTLGEGQRGVGAAGELEHRLQFERLVLGVSTHFINLGARDVDSAIEQALQQIGEFCGVDRAYVFSLSGSTMCNTHEWCAAGVEPQIHNLQELPVAIFPWWVARIERREVIHIPVVRDLPEEAAAERSILMEQDIVSVVVVPMVFAEKSVGFIGFDSIHEGKIWLQEDITLLRITGEIVVAALERKRADSERRELEEQLVQARSLENVARLAGGVAHDFNNLLSVILNYGHALERELSDSRLGEYVRAMSQAAEQAAELTRQLLIVGRRDLLEPERFDINAVLESLEHLLRRTLGEAVALELRTAATPCWVQMGKAHLKQVVVNLVVNARDALPTGGRVGISTEVIQNAEQAALQGHPALGCVRLQVSDDGVGMDAEVVQRSFEPFFSTKGASGTGLGLSTVHAIVRRAGGEVRIASQPGAGTTVDVYVPQVEPPARTEAQGSEHDPPRRGRGELILLVEDAEPLRHLLERMLCEHGYRVLAAADAEQALELLSQSGCIPELLLSDVILPGMSGRALAERLQAQSPRLRIAYVTGYDGEQLVRQGVLDSHILVLAKPFIEAELLRFVERALREEVHEP